MNVILFLGSGISIPSGFPAVGDLTKQILDFNLDKKETKFLNALSKYDNKARLIGGTTYLNNPDNAVGEVYRESCSYEDSADVGVT